MAQATVDPARAGSLAGAIRGRLVRPGDADYDGARKVWNGAIDARPELIVRCAGVADVVAAVNFARTTGLTASVRGGGHGVHGKAVSGQLVIDLGPMKGIRVDPTAGTCHAQAGLTWGEFNRETQVYGLATTGGVVSTTGIAGLTLGGGVGWIAGKCGLACDNAISFDVVTADGFAIAASAGEHSDLYWGLRGGGGNFGVVTSFQYRLHPISRVLGGIVAHPFARAKDVIRFYRDYVRGAPDELSGVLGILTAPAGIQAVGMLVCWCGAQEQGLKVLRPAKQFGPPLIDTITPMGYEQINLMLDANSPPGMLHYWKSDFLRELSDEAIETIIDFAARVPSPATQITLEHVHGAVSRVPADETAFPHRGAEFNFGAFSTWTDPADSEKNIQWTREFSAAMEPFKAAGAYVNYMDNEDEDRVRKAFGGNYERLAALKQKYDPANFFRLNQNIQPSA